MTLESPTLEPEPEPQPQPQPEPEPEPEPDADALKLSNDGIALFQVADELDNARRFNLPTVPTVR